MNISRVRMTWAWAALLCLGLCLGQGASAQDVAVRGKLGYQAGYAYTEEELAENALTLELALERRLGAGGRVHVDFEGRLSSGGGAQPLGLGEAYADVYLDAVDLRIGRQVINWGTADGINPTNVINPRGALSPAALLLSSGAPGGTPVVALQASYYLPSGSSLTGVGIAEFVPAAGGREMLDAFAAQIGAPPLGPLPVSGPDAVPAGSQWEWAARGEGLLGGHNIYVSYFRGWDDYPAAWVEFAETPEGPVPVRIAAAYRRMHKLGLATAGTAGDAGVWTEIAYTVFDELPALDGPGALSPNEPYLEAVVGADYTFRSGVMLSGQAIYSGGGSLLQPYKAPGAGAEPQTYLLGLVRYSPRPGHELQGVVFANAGDGGALAMGRYTYELRQAVSLSAGLARVLAGEESEFKALEAAVNLVTAGVEISF